MPLMQFWILLIMQNQTYIGRYNGSLSLYHKCLYIRREDSLMYKYGEDNSGDIQRLKQFMRKCCREISLWKDRDGGA